MARIVSIGPALQNLYLIDHDDLKAVKLNDSAIFGKIKVGTEVDIDKISYEVGGNGFNSAVSFARHGHETILMCNIGCDAAGDSILRALDRESVDTSYISYNKRVATGNSTILLNSKTGERTILTCQGAAKRFDNLVPTDLDLIYPDWVFVTNLCGNIEKLTEIFKKASEIKAKVAFCPGDQDLEDPKSILKLLKFVDVLIMNKENAAKLVPGTTLVELLKHLSGYVETIVITDGSMGGIATNREESYRFGIYEDVDRKDMTGAGDAFKSGFIAHLAAGKSFKSSIEFASNNATTVVQNTGSYQSILTGKEKLHPMPIQKL